MAFLQNLIVTGSSKFLNKIYATDMDVSGTFSTSGNISVGGTLNVTGSTTLKAVASSSIDNSGAFTNHGSFELIHATPFIDFHFNKSTADYTSRIIESTSGTITITPNLKVGTSATIPTATITTANISTSNMSTGIAENLNVTNKLHATHFDLQSVAQLGGAFYVSPTIKFPTNSSTTFTITKNGATANIIISDSAINSTTIAGVVWGANAKIKASGKIGTVTTGTMDGTVTSINTSSHTLTISVSGENSSSITAGTYTSTNIDNFCVMMYNTGTYPVGIMMNSYGTDGRTYIDIYGGTSAITEPNVRIGNLGGLSFNGSTLANQWGIYTNNGYYTGAIVANSGKIGGFTIGETAIYTGTVTSNADNSVALSSTDFTRTIGGTSRTGLRFAIGDKVGITGDGIFYGSNIQVSGGKIGGWNIASDFLYNYSTVTTGTASTQYGFRLCVGTSQTNQIIRAGSRSYDGTNYGSWENKFYVRNDGYMYATSGNIGGWGINTDNGLIHGTIGNADSVFLIPKGSTGAKAIGGSASTVTGWTITSGTNFGVTKTGTLYCSDVHATGEITATSGHIGDSSNGFTIDSSGFYSGTKTANNSGYIAMSNTAFSRTINDTALTSLNLAIGSKFGVTSDGTLYASGLNIKNIDADNITMGTVSIERLTSLELGGRNLLRDSALGIKYWVSNPVSGAVVNNGRLTMAVAGQYYQAYSGTSARPDSDYTVIPAGTTLTLSCYFYENTVTTGNHRIFYMSKPSWKSFTIPVGFTGLWTQTFTTTEDITRTTIDYDLRNMSAGEKWVVGPCKLEIGNKATDWSPAPEDVNEDINDASKTATNYLYYDSTNGLIISSSASAQTYASASTGYNTRLTSSALEIRNGTNVLASYGDTTVIGKNGYSQQIIDGTSMKFNSGTNETLFEINSNIIGTNEKTFYGYIDIGTGNLTVSSLSQMISDTLAEYDILYSGDSDYVQEATTSNTYVNVSIFGGYEETWKETDSQRTDVTDINVSNGYLTAKFAPTTSSTWTSLATAFINEFPSNTTFSEVNLIFNFIYPVVAVAMTLGSRNEETPIGMGSVAMGENNIVSGKYSYAFGRDLTVYDNYSVVVGESNALIYNSSSGEIQEAAFAVGANGATPFAILKNGTIMMSSVNTGKYPETFLNGGTKKEVSVTFEQEYPNPPFIFLTLSENNVTNITDYGRMQLYLKSVTTKGFKVDMVNGSTGIHDFGFNWFAICVNKSMDDE